LLYPDRNQTAKDAVMTIPTAEKQPTRTPACKMHLHNPHGAEVTSKTETKTQSLLYPIKAKHQTDRNDRNCTIWL